MASRLFDAGAPDVLYLVDLSNFVLRAYHAMGPLQAPTGEPTNATYVMVTMLERLLRERRPAMLAVAMDSGRRTFRSEIYPDYKATRPPASDDLILQLRRCQEIVGHFGIPILKLAGVEADDLLACAVVKAREHGIKVVIVGADKDLMQLVGDDVVLWDTMRDKVFGVEEVEERWGVQIPKLRDVYGLIGDTSDNIPGVPSVGPKTAKDLLTEFGSLEGVYENIDKITKKKLKETLVAHRDDAFLSRELVTLKTDCPIEFELEALRVGGRNVPELKRIYAELGFQRQLTALEHETSPPPPGVGRVVGVALIKSGPAATQAVATAAVVTLAALETRTEIALDTATLERFATAAHTSGKLALFVQGSGQSAARSVPLGLALSAEAGTGLYVPLSHRYVGVPKQLETAEFARVLGPLLGDPSVKKVSHDLKRNIVLLARAGIALEGIGFDTLLASYLIDPEAQNDFETIAQRELAVRLPRYEELTKKTRGHQLAFDELSVEEAAPWAAGRADAALRLWEALDARVAEASLERLLEELEQPLVPLLAELELRGVLVDTARLKGLGASCETELQRIEKKAHEIAGKSFNLSSPRQLEALLFDELGLKPLKRTKTSRSTDAETLEALAEEHELPRVILEHRQLSKLKGTYIDALPALVSPATGRVHCTWEQAVAATGRLSSTDPNLQNIPIRTELGRSIRTAFVAPPGHVLVSADYSQIELRVLAHLSKDPVLIEAFRTGQDIHTRTAMEVFEVPEDRVTSEMRRRMKAVNFGIIYGQGDSGLSKSINITRAEAASFIAAYFRRYEGVRRFMNATLDAARAGEAVKSLLGRRRMLPDIGNANRAKRLAAERIAMNMPIQGSAADLLKLAMLRLKKPVTPGTRMVLTVHDELVFEVPESEVEEAKTKIREAMATVYPLDVPLVVDVGHGKNWNEAH